MSETDLELVRAWVDAYYTHQDEQLELLAHPDIEIRPRAGQGERLYQGTEGLRRWLEATRAARSQIETFSVGSLPDGRVLAEATLEGTPVLALFEIRERRIALITMYLSDRELLQRIGAIDRPPTEVTTQSIHRPDAAGAPRAGS